MGRTGESWSASRPISRSQATAVRTVNFVRLFSAAASDEFDIHIFNAGDYVKAVEQKMVSETISKVLYPSDAVAGRARTAAAAGILLRGLRGTGHHPSLFASAARISNDFPAKVAIQLNDTHPALAIAELMRLFVDQHDLPWDTAWEITRATVAYTNHTLMPEALERWPVETARSAWCRAICRSSTRSIGASWIEAAQSGRTIPDRARRVSIIEDGHERQVRMAHLAIVGSHSDQRRFQASFGTGQDPAGAGFLSALAASASATRPTASLSGDGC